MRAAGSAARSSTGAGGIRGAVSGIAHALRVPGTGAPSRGRLALVATLLAAALLSALAPAAIAGKVVDRVVAGSTSSGTTGGLFNQPRGIAVNASGAGNAAVGDIFVVDGLNNRIQQLAANGGFIRAWGADVAVPAGGTGMETCTVAADCKAGTTPSPAIGGAFNAPQGIAIDQADGAIYVTDPGNRRVQKFTLPANPGDPVVFDRAWGWDVTTGGVTTFEVCTVAASCKQGASGANGGQFNTQMGSLAVVPVGNPTAGNVFVGDSQNRRAAEFEADGDFVRVFGWDVVPTGQAGDLGTNSFEICTSTATGACKGGQTGASGGPNGRFGIAQPVQLLVDAAGVLYASDASGARVLRFDTSETTPGTLLMPEIPGAAFGDAGTTNGLALNAAGRLLLARNAVVEVEDQATTPTVTDTHYVGSGLTASGIAVAPGSGDIYMASQTGGHRLFAADDDGAPAATAAATDPTNVTTSTATLNGTINPDGPLAVDYRFQYSADGVAWTDAGTAAGQLPGGNTPVPISVQVSRLEPNTFYRVRLVTRKAFGNPEQITAEAIFLTDALAPTAPVIVEQVPAWVDQTEATLQASISPGGLNTSYHFEYGTDPSNLDRRIPAEHQLFAGAGFDLVTLEASPTALTPETNYYFRVVATNAEGTTTSDLQPFETLNEDGLTQGRRFELVTPPDKGLAGETAIPVDAVLEHAPLPTPDGEKVAYAVGYARPDSGAASEPFYRASRGVTGWASSEISPPTDEQFVAVGHTTRNQMINFLSRDLECGFLSAPSLLTDDSAGIGVRDAGRFNLYRRDADGNYTLVPGVAPVDPEAVPPPSQVSTYDPVSASDDCKRVFFETEYRYPGVPFVDSAGGGAQGLYEWDDGVLRVPGEIPGPSGPELASQAAPGRGGVGASNPSVRNVLSMDGSRFFFTAPSKLGADVGQLAVFMREDGAVGVDVSQSQTATPNDGPSVFQKATPSGSHVFFTARYGLAGNGTSTGATSCSFSESTLGAGCDLYRYSVDSGTLIDVSASSNPGDSGGAGVAGVLDASDDGSRVYFAARGQLVAGEGNSEAENLAGSKSYNIYLWDSGTTSYVATVPQADVSGGASTTYLLSSHPTTDTQNAWAPRVTPSGSHLMFMSRADLDLTGYESGGAPELYLYSTQTQRTVCVSCRRDGEPSVFSTVPAGSVTSFPLLSASQPFVVSRLRPQISDDGTRVFFLSYDPLAPGAVSRNRNLYQWEEGQITLLATDRPDELLSTKIVGSSEDGDSVFFTTDQSRVAWDGDGREDLYVARVGGGFAGPAPRSEGCSVAADGCQGGGSDAVSTNTKTSSSTGSENVSVEARRSLALPGLSRKARKAAARRGVLAIRLRSSSAGRVTLTAKARLGERPARVGRRTVVIRKAGLTRVDLRLNAPARKRLRAGTQLRVTIEARQSGARTRTTSILLPGVSS
jgi:NHL repeat